MVSSEKQIPSALQKAREQLFWDRHNNLPEIDSIPFILRVMDIGTWQMVEALEKLLPEEKLKESLQNASCGALSPRSWNFWCLRLGLSIEYPSRFKL